MHDGRTGAEDEGPDPDVLRRRLYAPGAGEAELARYRSAVAEPPAAPPREQPPARPSALRRVLPPAAGVAAVVALVAALPLVPGRTAVAPAPSPVASGALAVPAAARDRFVQALAASQPPEVAQYLLLHPAARPHDLAAATRAIVDEHQGTGSATVPLHPDLAAGSGGRVTVVLVADRTLPLEWTVTRTAVRSDHRQYEQTVGQRGLLPQPGVPLSATVRYEGAAPRTLRVEAEDGVRWDAVIAFTD